MKNITRVALVATGIALSGYALAGAAMAKTLRMSSQWTEITAGA